MSVNVQVNVTTRQIAESSTESTFTVPGDLATNESIDIRKADTGIDPSGAPIVMNYDFAVGSSGAAGPVNVNVNHKSLALDSDPSRLLTPTTITDFFTSIANTGKMHAIPRLLRNGDLTYDMFYTNVGTGLIDAELIHQALILPPGELPAVVATGAAVIDVVTVFREWHGENRVYDVFILEGV